MGTYLTWHSDCRISLWTRGIDSGQCNDRPMDNISIVGAVWFMAVESAIFKKAVKKEYRKRAESGGQSQEIIKV